MRCTLNSTSISSSGYNKAETLNNRQKIPTPQEQQKEQQEIQKRSKILIASFFGFTGLQALLTQKGFCLHRWIPNQIKILNEHMEAGSSLIIGPLLQATEFLPKSIQGFSKAVFVSPIGEEVFSRGLIQEVLLKRLPVAVLKKINLKAADWVQSHPYAKISRVALSTLLFSLMHLDNTNCAESNCVIGAIPLGACLGMVVEMKGPKSGLAAAISLHALNNLYVTFRTGLSDSF